MKLEENLQAYLSLIQHNPDAICAFDLDGNMISANPAAEKITGYLLEELKLEHCFNLIPRIIKDQNELQKIKQYIKWTMEGEAQQYETTILNKQGEIVELSIKNVPIVIEGKLVGVYIIAKDITENKRTKQAFHEVESHFKNLVEEALVGVYIYQNGRLIYVNPIFSRMSGYTQEEITKMDIYDFVCPEDHEKVRKNIEQRLYHKVKSSQYHIRAQRKNGDIIDVEVHGTLTYFKGEPAIIGTVLDITERKKTEEILRKSDKLSIVGELAAGVAHEIRNPLTTIKGFVQLLKSTENNTNNTEYIEIMLQELDRVNLIVSELLLLAKPEVPSVKEVDIRRLFHDVITLVDTQAIINNVQIFTCFSSDTPSILCEENQIKQVFINIIKNAIEAMPDGGKIRIQIKPNKQDRILFRFVDEGHGISAERISRLGEPFYSTKERGTGLGLMVSFKIIENHGGNIYFSSKVNEGTTVDVILPISGKSSNPAAD